MSDEGPWDREYQELREKVVRHNLPIIERYTIACFDNKYLEINGCCVTCKYATLKHDDKYNEDLAYCLRDDGIIGDPVQWLCEHYIRG